jgi:hypothetical protein
MEGTNGRNIVAKETKLPVSGAKVVLRDPKALKQKDRKRIYANTKGVDEGIMTALSLTDGILAIMVESWELDLPIPSIRISSLDELDIADYDHLTDLSKDFQKAIFPSLVDTPENSENADSPFGGSND